MKTDPGAFASPRPIRRNWIVAGICILLAAMVWIVFGQTLGHQFVNFDDNGYVYESPTVVKGLTFQGILWAFAHTQVGHWAPLTAISHMLDCQIFGLWPGGHLLTNVLLHMAGTILLFLVMAQMTGALWRSAFVAAIFAVHPLHVESVAWVAERKDVLSSIFFMLTIAAYVRYTRKPPSLRRYFAPLFLFALGLMSKDMLVTLPFVLLLLDYWPLGRFVPHEEAGALKGNPPPLREFSTPFRLMLEKVPFFALSAAACVVQLVVINNAFTVERMPFPVQAANALGSYTVYLRQMIYPAGLAVSYTYPGNHLPAWEVMLALALLGSISATVFVWRRKYPFLPVGWLWNVGMLVPPVFGFIRIGHAQSDRYTYLPHIGLYMAIVWFAADLCASMRWPRFVPGVVGSIALAALTWRAWIQTTYWKNDLTLWSHAIAVTTGNVVAINNLGCALLNSGRPGEAIAQFQKALEIDHDSVESYNYLGLALMQEGKFKEAVACFQQELEADSRADQIVRGIGPASIRARAHSNLGYALQQNGQIGEAIAEYQKALEADPGYPEAYSNLGAALLQTGQVNQAIARLRQALEINPDLVHAHYNLALAFQQARQSAEAIEEYKETLDLNPGLVAAQNNLAYMLAACPRASLRRGEKALALALRANEATGYNNPTMLGTLAAAYAETGRFGEATEIALRALDLANSQSNTTIARVLQSHLALYKTGMPLRDENLGP